MNIDDKELLPGESILLTKKANAVIRINRSFRRGQEIAPSRTESVNARRPVMVNQNRDLLESNRHLEQEPSLLSYLCNDVLPNVCPPSPGLPKNRARWRI